MKNILRAALASVPLLLAAGIAEAHTGTGHGVGFIAGVAHPLGGADHALAMIAVGILAAQLGGRALWALPLAFLGMLAVGGALGVSGVALPMAELGIAGSVFVLGAMIASGWRLPVAVAVTLAGVFGVFHGHAHGAEMPAAASGLAYGAGFMLATAFLHTMGIGLGFAAARIGRRFALRVGGGAIAFAGVALALS